MSTESPESGLVIRVNDRAVSVSREDADQISSAGGVVVEILESLLKLTIDDRTAKALRSEGNGQSHGPTLADIREIAQTLHAALTALRARVLAVDQVRAILTDLKRHAGAMRQSFEARAADSTPRPMGPAAGHAASGGLLAGLLDATGALNQFVDLLEDVASRSK